MRKKLLIVTVGIPVGGLVVLSMLWLTLGRLRQPSPPPTATPDALLTAEPSPAEGAPQSSPAALETPHTTDVCPSSWARLLDTDSDGLPDRVEITYGTNHQVSDTDGDGFGDGEEVRNGYDPRQPGSIRLDSDGDGLLEQEECQWQTSPFNPDTDGDGFKDGEEVRNGFDPTKKGDGKGSDRLRPAAPTPVTPPAPTRAPATTPPPKPPTTAALPEVKRSELTIIKKNAPADIRAYLAQVDRLRPAAITDGNALTDALTQAFQGQPQKLAAVRGGIKEYERALLAVPVPEKAVEHHRLLIALTRFVNDRLGVMEQYATADRARVLNAALEMQQALPQYIGQLQNLYRQLVGSG